MLTSIVPSEESIDTLDSITEPNQLVGALINTVIDGYFDPAILFTRHTVPIFMRGDIVKRVKNRGVPISGRIRFHRHLILETQQHDAQIEYITDCGGLFSSTDFELVSRATPESLARADVVDDENEDW